MSLYRNLETDATSTGEITNDRLKQFLAGVASEPSMLNMQANLDFLTHEIGVQLYGFMLQAEEEIDVKQPLATIGVDSLVAIEIRNWWRQSLGLEISVLEISVLEISVLEIVNGGLIEQLGKTAAEGLRRKFETESAQKYCENYLSFKVRKTRSDLEHEAIEKRKHHLDATAKKPRIEIANKGSENCTLIRSLAIHGYIDYIDSNKIWQHW